MKATELRIGNWYSSGVDMDTGEQVYNQVLPDLYMNWHVNGCWAKPIPLTKEWLERFGFEINQNGYYQKGEYKISDKMEFYFFDVGDWQMTINYVHQLQNLYFSLTGKELTIKE